MSGYARLWPFSLTRKRSMLDHAAEWWSEDRIMLPADRLFTAH